MKKLQVSFAWSDQTRLSSDNQTFAPHLNAIRGYTSCIRAFSGGVSIMHCNFILVFTSKRYSLKWQVVSDGKISGEYHMTCARTQTHRAISLSFVSNTLRQIWGWLIECLLNDVFSTLKPGASRHSFIKTCADRKSRYHKLTFK